MILNTRISQIYLINTYNSYGIPIFHLYLKYLNFIDNE